MNKFIAAVVFTLCSSVASANTLYNVNRIVGAGSVVGTIETDGTLGTITLGNIVDWTLTLTSPFLVGGSPDFIAKATAGITSVNGGFVQATANELSFDFSASPSNGWLLFQGGDGNYWCMQTNGCFGGTGGHEAIAHGTVSNFAEEVAYTTRQVIATAVPEPGTLVLMLVGGLVVVGSARQRRQR